MLLSQSRIAPWIIWFLAGLASLVWLPRLLGNERLSQSTTTKRPAAVLTGVTALPDEPVLHEISTPRELKLLVPLEAEPSKEPATKNADQRNSVEQDAAPTADAAAPSLHIADVESDGTPLVGKPVPAPVTLDPQIEEAPSPQPELAEPQATLKIAPPLEDEPASQVTAPPTPEPQTPMPLMSGIAARYWIVSTRCCRQTKHKCGINCRFVCHAVTEDCQCVPVCFEQFLAGQIPSAPTCILVHGSFTQMKDVWEDSECTYRWLRGACPQVPLNFIYFTWPSEGPFAVLPNNPFTTPVPIFDFGVLGHRADVNGFYLADLIGALPPPTTVSLVGHSLGTRTIAAGLHLLGGGQVCGQPRWNPADCGHRIRVVMAAAAIEHDWLNPGNRFGCALNRAECLLSLRNECDLALALFPLRKPFSSRALARSGFTKKDQRKLGDRLLQVSELDVTQIIGKGHGWPRYSSQPAIAAAVSPYVYFEAATGVVQSASLAP